ncbi:MAG: sugar ABC transporter permease [Chloroflexota bacterium]|nr:sugar ABC transporter permease [Chloroflexota bacterium]
MANRTLAIPRATPVSRGADLWLELKRSRAAYLLMLPFLLHFVVVVAYPFAYSVYLSFFDASLNRTPVFIGLGNFLRLAQDAQFRHALGNTAYFTLFAMIGETVLSLLVAFMMNEQLRGRLLLRTAFFLPVVTSWVIVSIMWSMLFAREGLINGALRVLGLPIQPFLASPVQAMWIIIALSVWKNVGYFMVIFLAGLQSVPQELYEAAALDGASRLRQMWHVAIPGLRPVIYFVVSISMITSAQLFVQPFIMTQGGPLDSTLSVVMLLYRKSFNDLEFGYGSAMGTVLLLILVGLSLANRKANAWLTR